MKAISRSCAYLALGGTLLAPTFAPLPAKAATPNAPRVASELQSAHNLFTLLDQRLVLMRAVALSKWQSGGAIEDRPREAVVIERARQQAAQEGLQSIDAFTRAQIEIAKQAQRRWHERFATEGVSGREVAPSLTTIRTNLNKLDAQILSALTEALPSLRDPQLRHRLHTLFLRDYRSANLRNSEREQVFKALLQVRFAPRATTPPLQTGSFRPSDLVELKRLDPTLKLDIRYAGTNNFAKRRLYSQSRAFLQRPAAQALVRASQSLRSQGYGLIVFDGYRPWRVTRTFWEITPDAQKQFVADPNRGSRHNRGCAVDVSLYDLKTGLPLAMPSDYDDFSQSAYPSYSGASASARANRDRLRRAMEAQGFSVYPTEWWHFDYKDWRQYRILDIPFEEL